MTVEEALKAYIETQVPNTGNGYPVEVPGDADFPAWAYSVIDDEQILAHNGGTGLVKARIQLDFMAKESGGQSDYAIVKDIAKQVRTRLDGFKGDMSGLQVEFCHTTLNDDWADIHKLPVQRFDVLINYILES